MRIYITKSVRSTAVPGFEELGYRHVFNPGPQKFEKTGPSGVLARESTEFAS